MITACEKLGEWKVALELFDQMQREGCAPNVVVYNSLLTACAQGTPLPITIVFGQYANVQI